MTKDVQQVRMPFEDLESYIGLDGQLIIDETNNRLTMHDAVTPGGHIIVSRDEGDERWQHKIADLDAFEIFEPFDRGFLTRLGPVSYALRQIIGDAESTSVDNPKGQAGDVIVRLLDVIEKDLTFNGLIQFTTVISALGLIGDTQGDHTGDVLGNVTGNLTGDSTGTHHGAVIGSIDARGSVVHFDNGQIPQAAIAGLVTALSQAAPSGIVSMWSGAADAIPAGWFLCNGANGTPDLRGMFIIGAGGDFGVGESDGTFDYTPAGTLGAAGAHVHTGDVGDHALTVSEIPAHHHNNGITDDEAGFVFNHGYVAANPTTTKNVTTNSGTGSYEGVSADTGGGVAHDHPLMIDSAGNHTHVFTGTAATIVPPYYALCYIMKG